MSWSQQAQEGAADSSKLERKEAGGVGSRGGCLVASVLGNDLLCSLDFGRQRAGQAGQAACRLWGGGLHGRPSGVCGCASEHLEPVQASLAASHTLPALHRQGLKPPGFGSRSALGRCLCSYVWTMQFERENKTPPPLDPLASERA